MQENEITWGREIFESVPIEVRPGWGQSLLMTFDNFMRVPAEIVDLYEIIDDKRRWKEAHGQFQKIRLLTLYKKGQFVHEAYLLLAENIAKVTYNLSGGASPFDHDCGWYIPGCALKTADVYRSEQVSEEIMRILTLHHKR